MVTPLEHLYKHLSVFVFNLHSGGKFPSTVISLVPLFVDIIKLLPIFCEVCAFSTIKYTCVLDDELDAF